MRPRPLAMVLLFAVSLCTLPERGAADDPLPMPRKLHDDDGPAFSSTEFERQLLKLKTEREGLHSDWQALRKRNTTPEPTLEAEQKRFESLMKKALDDLRQRRLHPALAAPLGQEVPKKKIDTEPEDPKKSDNTAPAPAVKSVKPPAVVDFLAQAHTLMRAKRYEEALATFQQVDLKGKKVNERTPIQYLKACCLLHLGKSKEAGEVLQEVANYRSDGKVAGYAQWQLEMLRWQRDITARLQDIRQRHEALEVRK